jgi:hypothetical protein
MSRAAGWLLGAALIFGSGFYTEKRLRDAADNERALAEVTAALDSANEAQRLSARLAANSQKVQDELAARNRSLAVAVDGARAERDGLRIALQASPAPSNPASASSRIVARTDTVSAVVNECADVVQTMARTLDERESTVKDCRTGLNQWRCVATSTAGGWITEAALGRAQVLAHGCWAP